MSARDYELLLYGDLRKAVATRALQLSSKNIADMRRIMDGDLASAKRAGLPTNVAEKIWKRYRDRMGMYGIRATLSIRKFHRGDVDDPPSVSALPEKIATRHRAVLADALIAARKEAEK